MKGRKVDRTWTVVRMEVEQMDRRMQDGGQYEWMEECVVGDWMFVWMDRGMDAGASSIPRRKPKAQGVSEDSPLRSRAGPPMASMRGLLGTYTVPQPTEKQDQAGPSPLHTP